MACPKHPFPRTSPWMRSDGRKMRWVRLETTLSDSDRLISFLCEVGDAALLEPGDLSMLQLRLRERKDKEDDRTTAQRSVCIICVYIKKTQQMLFSRDYAGFKVADVRVGGLGDWQGGAGAVWHWGGQAAVHLILGLLGVGVVFNGELQQPTRLLDEQVDLEKNNKFTSGWLDQSLERRLKERFKFLYSILVMGDDLLNCYFFS